MHTISYRAPQAGDEHELSACMWASANLWDLTDGTPESINAWREICAPDELRGRILSREKALVATWHGIIVGFIAFRRRNHLSLLFIRREFSRRGIGRELFMRCSRNMQAVTVNSADTAVGFYQKIGFVQQGDRFCKQGIWATPMQWLNPRIY